MSRRRLASAGEDELAGAPGRGPRCPGSKRAAVSWCCAAGWRRLRRAAGGEGLLAAGDFADEPQYTAAVRAQYGRGGDAPRQSVCRTATINKTKALAIPDTARDHPVAAGAGNLILIDARLLR